MSVVEICIYFIVAILGLTYPILLQVVARIDDKYGNDFYSLFLKEREYLWFKRLLHIALILILFYAIVRVFNVLWPYVPVLILSRIIRFAILVASSVLLYYLTLLINKVLVYYNPQALVIYMIERNSAVISSNQFLYFNALFYLLKYSILAQNDKVVKTITDTIYKCFNDFRKNNPNNPDGYPEEYYQFALDTADLLLNLKGHKYGYVEHRAICGPWLLGDFVENKINDKTYNFQWHLIRLAIDANSDDLVVAFWEHSDQYFQYSLRLPETKYSQELKILNEAEINDRKKEQQRFLQFHFALGGLLMYLKRYDCIKRCFRFTSSEPPSYYLLPSSMTEVFSTYIFYRDWYERNIPFIGSVYPFPKVEGVKADGIIRNWICKYTAVLFLRQYTLLQYYTFQEFLALPALPEKVGEKKFWLENMDYFKTLTSQILEDKEMLQALGFDNYDYISDQWCEQNKKPKPLELIDNVQSKIEDEIQKTEYAQEPDPEKVKQFKESTITIISQLFTGYQSIINSEEYSGDKQHWYVTGIRYLFEKSAFCLDQGVDYANAHSIGAQSIADRFKYQISETFYFTKFQSFLIKDTDLGVAFSRLKLKGDKHIIIAFGINEYRLSNFGLFNDGLYNNIQVVAIQACNYQLMGESFFILKKEDLPYLKFNTPEKEIEHYKLEQFKSEIGLFGGIINLYREESIRKELEDSNKDKDLNKYVLAYIALQVEIQWKKNIKMIQIRLDSPYDQRGLSNNPNDIKPFDQSKMKS